MRPPVVEARDLRKRYQLGKVTVEALRGVDLSVDRGEFVAIAGPSGSGKTTLLNVIGCLDTPTSGTIMIDGQRVASFHPAQLAEIRLKKIGFIFQTFNLIPVLTTFENVEYPLLLQGAPKSKRKAAVMQALQETGLAHVAHHRPVELSGGQQQRAAIARALVAGPSIVLADEPTANLDSQTAQEIIELMLTRNRVEGVTFIFSTHDSRIMKHASRPIEIRDGQILARETRS